MTKVDRIVFLRIAEDRGLATYGGLQDVIGDSGIYGRLLGLFRDVQTRDTILGLFSFCDRERAHE